MAHHCGMLAFMLTSESTIPSARLVKSVNIPKSDRIPGPKSGVDAGKLGKQTGRWCRVEREDVPPVQVVRAPRREMGNRAYGFVDPVLQHVGDHDRAGVLTRICFDQPGEGFPLRVPVVF